VLFFKSSQFFELNRSSSFQVPTPVLTDTIYLSVETAGRKYTVLGDFPRRVSIGEVLLRDQDFKVFSPINGIAHFDLSINAILLRIDGQLNTKPEFQKKEYTFLEMKTRLNELGVVTLDYPSLPFFSLLETFKSKEKSQIIFAPFTQENFLDYKGKILEKLSVEFQAFKSNLKKILPKSTILDFLTEKKEIESYSYPDGNPKYFLYKYCNQPLYSEIPKEDILYIGPETLYHLLYALYYSIPFHERLLSITVINHKGLLEGETRVYRVKNGTNLKEFLSLIKEKYGYRFFTINSFYDKQPVYEIGADFIFDIYRHHSIIVCEQIISKDQESVCIDCNDCSYFCPVDANPRALLDKDKSLFDKSICIQCGLCSVFCPAHIDFSNKILEEKEGAKFAIS
jgi:ferredoxin